MKTEAKPAAPKKRPALKISTQDLGQLFLVHLPTLAFQIPQVRSRLKEMAKEDELIAPFVQTIEDIYRLVTT